MVSSDDESSDSSSDDFLVSPDKINLDSTFFDTTVKKNSNPPKSKRRIESSESEESDNDFICQDEEEDEEEEEEHVDSADLLAEVMRNLEKANADAIKYASYTNDEEKNIETSPKKDQAKSLENEINEMLLQSESGLGSFENNSDDENNAENTKQDEPSSSGYTIPKEGVDIILPGTELIFNRRQKKKGIDLQAELIKKMNQRLRKSQLYIHKVGLLCWLSHGFHINRQINDPNVLALAMSLVPTSKCPDGRIDLKYLEQFTKWFKKLIKLEFNKQEIPITSDLLLERIKNKIIHNYRELVLVYIATLRAIGLNCRLVVSLCAPAMKLRQEQLFKSVKKQEDELNKKKKPSTKKSKLSSKDLKKKNVVEKSSEKIVPKNSQERERLSKEEAKQKAVELLRAKFSRPIDKKNKKSIKDIDKIVKKSPVKKEESDDDIRSPPKVRQLRSKAIPLAKTPKAPVIKKNLKEKKTVEDENKIKSPEVEKKMGRISVASTSTTSTMSDSGDSSSDEDIKPDKIPIKNKIIENVKKESRRSSIDRRVLSDDEEQNQDFIEKFDVRDSRYMWVEVYVESEESWISVSVPDEKIHCVSEIYKKIPTPVLYIIGFNSLGCVKDLTRRYAPHWLTSTRKQRIDETWWSDSLSPFLERRDTKSIAEDEMLLQKELEQPLPKTLSECKSHPLYVVVRHLLKFEALYPPDCVPLGHLKNGDAIYSRHCVHTLRSRETWNKQARVVKPKQEPYKIVKAMPKYDKMTGQRVKDMPLELFGQWQTTPYVPPEAKDGKVPRNEYGNVDLFQQCMLPKGTVHIDLPGLNRVARKLGIDCSPAVVGFNFGCRGALPAFEGFVVCEEFEDTVREAWEQEQIDAEKRANEKRDKRIWGNWRKLIRGLMIRERLALKYDFGGKKDEVENPPSSSSSSTKRPKLNSKQPAKKLKKT